MLLIRSVVFNLLFFGLTTVMVLSLIPLLALERRWMIGGVRLWSRCVICLLRVVCGVRLEVRGLERLPQGAAVLAAKHQSAFDTIVWLSLVPDPAYVLKAELLRIPIYGWHVRHAGMIPVDREGGGTALRGMLRAAQAALAAGRQVVIFPEGTRTAPGMRVPYHPGVVAIAAATSAPVLPVATNSGRIWGRRAFLKRPGVIHISILPPLPKGLARAALLSALESAIEEESARLLME